MALNVAKPSLVERFHEAVGAKGSPKVQGSKYGRL